MQQAIHTVYLHGSLSEFGDSYQLAVNTPLEAIRALSCQLQGFAEAIQAGMFRVVRGQNPDTGLHYEVPYNAEKNEYDVSMLRFSLGANENKLHIVPVVAGAKSGGGKAILGVVIMAAAAAATWHMGGSGGWTVGSALIEMGVGIAPSSVIMFGAALTLGGVGMMLQPSVKTNYSNNESADQRASIFLGGQTNQNSQGGPVVLAYGRCRVGTTVISAGLSAERI